MKKNCFTVYLKREIPDLYDVIKEVAVMDYKDSVADYINDLVMRDFENRGLLKADTQKPKRELNVDKFNEIQKKNNLMPIWQRKNKFKKAPAQ